MDQQEKTSFTVKNLIMFILIPGAVMYLFEAYTHNPFVRMKPGIQILNIFLFIILECLLLFITGSLRAALCSMCILFAVLGLTEYYLVEFRGVPLLPWDIGSLGTAAEVASGYDYMPDSRALLCIAGFVLLFITSLFADYRIIRSWTLLIPGVFISAALIVIYTLFVQTEFAVKTFGFYTRLFTPKAISERDGTATAFLMELQYVNVKKPKGYSKEEAEKMLEEYETAEASEQMADIIVIMNEAFSDLSVLGSFKTSEDYMPFIHSLQSGGENVITGELNVSIVGGNTPNTEFEFLTGNTLAFLPEGSIPYQQYVHEGIYALPAYLKDMGYETVGMHPFYARGWERDRVYPLLGFSKIRFLDDFDKEASMLRGYVSDRACSDQIIKEYEDNLSTGKPFFSFLVTMQNHSPYDDKNGDMPQDVKLETEAPIKNSDATERYLSLIKRSDEAFRYLTEYYSKTERPAVLVFFGDHEPSDSVVRPVYRAAGKNPADLSDEDIENRYVVPYVIWTNFDIETVHDRDTSANLLANDVLKLSGAGAYPYRVFLDELYEKYPVLSAVRIEDPAGRRYEMKDTGSDPEIDKYRKLQYYELFDKGR